tara:strand:- start:110 stop:376 length:267 start_codon:yes stop_codon:yes gene_type:complete
MMNLEKFVGWCIIFFGALWYTFEIHGHRAIINSDFLTFGLPTILGYMLPVSIIILLIVKYLRYDFQKTALIVTPILYYIAYQGSQLIS